MNKFEQISSDHHQMSLGILPDLSRGGGLYLTFPKGVVHYHVTYSMMYLMILYSGVVTRLFIGS